MHLKISSPHPQVNIVWSSYKERRVDALALRADERRDKLRKASGRSKYPLIQISSPHPQVNIVWSSYKERRVDALALRADERRDKLRKASGRSKYPLIRRYLNGETRL